jgi:hypothetical protein
VLFISCSFLVSSSPSKVGKFGFECCPLVQEISSAIHYLPCFGDGFSLCLFTESSLLGVYFFAPPSFSGAGSVFHPPHLLSMLDYSLLFIFQFCRGVQFWMLFPGSGVQLCNLLPALLWGVAYQPPSLSLHCLSCVYLLIAPCSSSFLQCSFSVPLPLLLSVSDYSLLFVIQFCWGGINLPRGCAGFCSQGVDRGFVWCVVLTCLFCQLTCRQVWSSA